MSSLTRECLAIDVAGNIRSTRVIEMLGKLMSVHGSPQYLRSESGPDIGVSPFCGPCNPETFAEPHDVPPEAL